MDVFRFDEAKCGINMSRYGIQCSETNSMSEQAGNSR